jgi:hypothetical protein
VVSLNAVWPVTATLPSTRKSGTIWKFMTS